MASWLSMGLIVFPLLCIPIGTINVTVCDCKTPMTIGLMDLQLPTYCKKNGLNNLVQKKYEFYIAKNPHITWTAHVCSSWIKIKLIDGYFFGAFDTKERSSSKSLSISDCWRMIETNSCGGNQMIVEGNLHYFKTDPEGEGTKMR